MMELLQTLVTLAAIGGYALRTENRLTKIETLLNVIKTSQCCGEEKKNDS